MLRDVRLAHNYFEALFQSRDMQKITALLNKLATSQVREVKQFAIERSRAVSQMLAQQQQQLAGAAQSKRSAPRRAVDRRSELGVDLRARQQREEHRAAEERGDRSDRQLGVDDGRRSRARQRSHATRSRRAGEERRGQEHAQVRPDARGASPAARRGPRSRRARSR